jgi:hypothetical protein
MRKLLPYLLPLCVSVVGCKKDQPPKELPFDADARSGPDGKRAGARTLRPNTPVTDEVNFQKQDQTDWYTIQLAGKPGVLTTDVTWDNGGSDVMVDIFDEAGTQVSASPARATTFIKEKHLLTQIERLGTYFIRVTAPNKPDGSVYTMVAKWEEPVVGEPAPTPTKKKKEVVKKEETVRPDGMSAHEKADNSVQGRIVSAYNDGNALTLQIDKGTAAGIKVGMSGAVLEGSSGEDPLEGGAFKIVEVVGPSKCLAKASIKSIGKNTRVVITLSR